MYLPLYDCQLIIIIKIFEIFQGQKVHLLKYLLIKKNKHLLVDVLNTDCLFDKSKRINHVQFFISSIQ
jgi:hypothetical protein